MSNYRPWSLEDMQKLEDYIRWNKPIEMMCSLLDRSKISIINQMKKSNMAEIIKEEALASPSVATLPTPKARRTVIEKAAVNFLDMRIKDRDYTGLWDSILDFQNVLEEKSIEQNIVSIHIDTKQWIGIVFQGDLHIGNMATDYKTMLEHRDLIAATDNLYVCLNGDYCDNFIPTSHAAGMFEALFPPAVQKNLAKDYIEKIISEGYIRITV